MFLLIALYVECVPDELSVCLDPFLSCFLFLFVEMCLLSNRVSDYPYVCHGKTRIPGVNDSIEAELTDVRAPIVRTGSEQGNL